MHVYSDPNVVHSVVSNPVAHHIYSDPIIVHHTHDVIEPAHFATVERGHYTSTVEPKIDIVHTAEVIHLPGHAVVPVTLQDPHVLVHPDSVSPHPIIVEPRVTIGSQTEPYGPEFHPHVTVHESIVPTP
jgi:hypothetical protein